MNRRIAALLVVAAICAGVSLPAVAQPAPAPDVTAGLPAFRLGNEVLLARHRDLIDGKKIGLVTNQTGVDSLGRSTAGLLASMPGVSLVALFAPEHGLDGLAAAGEYVASYQHPELDIPVYSLYGPTRMPTQAMLAGIDILLYDIQDIGARTYTYISTLNYVMRAAKEHGTPVVVLDRPNPLGGETVEGPVLEDGYKTFVGVDNLPMAHGMTAGELARYFNRLIGADLTIVPMEGYTRQMIYQDTGLAWIPTSPNIPDLDAAFGYMATGLGEGTGIYQQDRFKWIGGRGIDPDQLAYLLNNSGLPGVFFVPSILNNAPGVRPLISDYRTFNPAKTGLFALAYAKLLTDFPVPQSGATPTEMVMFDKVMGTRRVGDWLRERLLPREIMARYADELAAFRSQREQYLLYGDGPAPGQVTVVVDGMVLHFDSPPYIDENNRTMVPFRAIGEAIGATVSWDEYHRVVTLVRGATTVRLTIDSTLAVVNNRAVRMDTRAVIRNSRTMVPVRYVGELLGREVAWNAEYQIVEIR